ncbi:MAG TPA: choice-of-anchor R domain-containing protein [Candidatus Paceibacterota bacterium]|nr:choice-of-anchor R domain-containing protein [Candidatus Paceibacterota bacterium]
MRKFFEEYKKIPRNKGAAMLVSVIFFLFISLAIIAGLVAPSVRGYRIANADLKSKNSYYLAESGMEDAVYRILAGLPISDNETLGLDSNSVSTTITTVNSNQRRVESLGDVSSFERKLNLLLTTSTGVSFNYGVQVGQGGMDLQGSSGIVGNVYANGPITGGSSCYITGTAISGNSPAIDADQSNGTGIPNYNVVFANANATQDIAQSFQTSEATPLNKIQVYIKKVGSPSNATVKIVNNSNGNPGTTVYASGTLNASSVTTSYGWVDVAFSTNPMLNIGTTYWLVVDASSSSSKYYTVGASSGGYSNGSGKIGQQGGTWSSTSPAGLDYFFKVYLGGFTGLIAGSSGSQWNQFKVGTDGSGSAQAHTVNYTSATGDIYCQSGTGNNKACLSQADPVYQAMPVSEANIAQWKSDAEAGGTYSGTYSTQSYGTTTLGPKKITGDLNVTGSNTLYVTGTLYVQGNITVSGSAKIVLHSSYGNTSGIIVSDGWLDLQGSGQLNGNGQTGSYILFVTTSNCDSSYCAHNAIDISGAAGSVVLNAQNGTISFSGSASAKEATAYKIKLSGATIVRYESGLANMNFTSGPSGSWSVQNWKEVE